MNIVEMVVESVMVVVCWLFEIVVVAFQVVPVEYEVNDQIYNWNNIHVVLLLGLLFLFLCCKGRI